MYSRLSTLQEGLIPKKRAGADDDLHRINELIQVTLLLLVKIFPQLVTAADHLRRWGDVPEEQQDREQRR